ncbi:hypothetical protein [Rhizobium laguerreae]|uniref:Uncharacterized protein n=1 Tax=Rhizobium laguerreae TaxID=1076926 RepID=A0AAX2QN69_9HYPH|nr:hypothetical protein [Rhizobium laguerreae]TCU25318.1 hypothetical protein EV131_105432 [Rhizobium laguerreae]
MSDEPIFFEEAMHSVEANIIVNRAIIILSASGHGITPRRVWDVMRTYFSPRLLEEHSLDINMILDELESQIEDVRRGINWSS